jgi:hypothetical protein
MHPETGWMIHQAEATARQHRLQQQQRQLLLAYPCLQHRVAFWSGHHLLQCAQWLLRYGQQYEQWTLGVTDVGRGVRS